MFKKIYKKIDDKINVIKNYVSRCYTDHEYIHSDVKKICDKVDNIPDINNMVKTIASQQRTIEQLTNALKDKYEHGLFIVSEDCKIPMVIRNGKEITNELTSWFRIDWTHGGAPNIEIEQFVGTFGDSED